MNNCAFVGRLTTTPELRTTPNGKSVCSFSLAVDRKFSKGDEKIVDYIDFVAWNSQADFLCKWFDKGVRVAVTGELQTRMYEKDGKKNKIFEVLVATVEFADGKREANATQPATTESNTSVEDDDFGFIPMSADEFNPF